MAESLRERQKQLAREAILQAAADEIAEHGLSRLSLEAVADRAGVSSRTLYNYFDSRDTLLIALGRWSDELTGRTSGWSRPNEPLNDLKLLPEAVPIVWRAWEAQGTIYDALHQIDAAGSTGAAAEASRADRNVRSESLRAALAALRPDLPDDEIEELTALLHAILGPALWYRMKTVYGLDSRRTGPAVTWMMQLLIDALSQGDHPRRTEVEARDQG